MLVNEASLPDCPDYNIRESRSAEVHNIGLYRTRLQDTILRLQRVYLRASTFQLYGSIGPANTKCCNVNIRALSNSPALSPDHGELDNAGC